MDAIAFDPGRFGATAAPPRAAGGGTGAFTDLLAQDDPDVPPPGADEPRHDDPDRSRPAASRPDAPPREKAAAETDASETDTDADPNVPGADPNTADPNAPGADPTPPTVTVSAVTVGGAIPSIPPAADGTAAINAPARGAAGDAALAARPIPTPVPAGAAAKQPAPPSTPTVVPPASGPAPAAGSPASDGPLPAQAQTPRPRTEHPPHPLAANPKTPTPPPTLADRTDGASRAQPLGLAARTGETTASELARAGLTPGAAVRATVRRNADGHPSAAEGPAPATGSPTRPAPAGPDSGIAAAATPDLQASAKQPPATQASGSQAQGSQAPGPHAAGPQAPGAQATGNAAQGNPASTQPTAPATMASRVPDSSTASGPVDDDAAGALPIDRSTDGATAAAPQGQARHGVAVAGGDRPMPAPQALAAQIAVQVHKGVQRGADRIDIQLTPAELGRIEVRLEFTRDGRVNAAIAADRPDTLDLLQRDARGLERALQDAGLKADSGGLTFTLRDGGRQGFGHQPAAASHHPTADGLGPRRPDMADPAAAVAFRSRSDRAIDIHV